MNDKRQIPETEWIEILKAAPDPGFYGQLQALLESAQLPHNLPKKLDEAYLAPTRRAGWATVEQCASAWYNIGIAAVSLPEASPEVALFATECSQLVAELAPEAADLSLRNHFIPVQALLILTSSEETTSPRLCRRLLAEDALYLEALRERLAQIDPNKLETHLSSALSITLRSIMHLVDKRRALGALDAEMGLVVALALALVAQVEPDQIQSLAARIMTGLDPVTYLRFVGAQAELNLGLETASEWEEHVQRALAYLNSIQENNPAALPAPTTWGIDLARAFALWRLNRAEEALASLPNLPRNAPAEVQQLRLHHEGLCREALGDLDRARDALTRTAHSEEKALESWKARWFGGTLSGQPAIDLRGEDPLTVSQTDWRHLALISAQKGDMAELLLWATRASGFLVDSLFRKRSEWVNLARQRLCGPQILESAWSSDESWSNEIFKDMTAANGIAPNVPVPNHPVTVEDNPSPNPLAQIDELLASIGSPSALLLITIAGQEILTVVARYRDGQLALSAVSPSPDSRQILDRLSQWDHHYLGRLRHDPSSPEALEEGVSRFNSALQIAEDIWSPLLSGLVEHGFCDLVFVADDLIADLPFHAIRLEATGLRLIDRARITYTPSLYTAWRCSRRSQKPKERRLGLKLMSLADPHLTSAQIEPAALAALLETERREVAPDSPAFWPALCEAEVLHVVAHGQHNVLLPLNSLWLAGWIDLGITKLIAGLEIPSCEVVSNLICEAAFPAIRRTPGIDFSSVFLSAGGRSVLASTWVVSDELASELCLAFFESWKGGKSASDSFQSALIDLRRKHPSIPDFYWAGFRLVGGA